MKLKKRYINQAWGTSVFLMLGFLCYQTYRAENGWELIACSAPTSTVMHCVQYGKTVSEAMGDAWMANK